MAPDVSQGGMAMPQFTAGPGPPPLPRPSKKYYTFQRVNGNGGNGKGDGVAGPHKHTLEESDRVKKNSVIRWMAKVEKDDRKKTQVSLLPFFRFLIVSLLFWAAWEHHALQDLVGSRLLVCVFLR